MQATPITQNNGKYEWTYEMSLFKNPHVFLLVAKVLLGTILGVSVFLWLIAGIADGFSMESLRFAGTLLLILLGIFSVLQLVMNLRNAKKAAPVDTLIPDKRIIFSIAAILAYAALWDIIGFCASTIIFLILEAKILKRDVDTRTTVLIALAGTAVGYLVFGVAFHVYLSEPLLEYVM